MKSVKITYWLPCIFLFLFCCGCTNQLTIKPHSMKKPVNHINIKNDDSKINGTVISMKKINVPYTNPSLQAYRMMYWSEKVKTEAYVTAPKSPGSYVLYVLCHGGWATSEKKSHVSYLTNEQDIVSEDEKMIKLASNDGVTLFPMYRGYGNSGGTVNGLYGNTIDTQNAIKAAINYFNDHKRSPNIQLEKGKVYLGGVSMGGGVVLNTASKRDDVLSVIAISPFVGWDIVGAWEKSKPKWASYFLNAKKVYGPFNPQSPAYQKQSIQYKKIQAPTLLIQGTNDPNIPWQTVRIFYRKMKSNGQNVTLRLVKDGNHALTNKQKILNEIINNWYQSLEK